MSAAMILAAFLAPPGGQPGQVQHDPFSRAREVFRFSFETAEDKDFDLQPDDWIRRRGPLFPAYVRSEIDQETAQHGKWSLRFDVNGGRVIAYSPTKQIDALHAYVFEGYIRTRQLQHDAAMISLSLLDYRRQRVQRLLSRPVSGTHNGWVKVRIGPFVPQDDVRFIVVGCHLVHDERKDLRGKVWFDNLRLGQIPQLSLASGFEKQYIDPNKFDPRNPKTIVAHVGGLEKNQRYLLRILLYDLNGRIVDQQEQPLVTSSDSNAQDDNRSRKPQDIKWEIARHPHGYYRVHAQLTQDGKTVAEEQSSLIIMDFERPARDGEFGWSMVSNSGTGPLKDLAEVVVQSGVNRLKYPLWQTIGHGWPRKADKVAPFLETLTHRQISVVGLLSDPPPETREKFSKQWRGVGEIFLLPRKFWWQTVEAVIARYSATVRYWQIGSDADRGLVDVKELPKVVRDLKSEFDTIARDVRIGIPWDLKTVLPDRHQVPYAFFPLIFDQPAHKKQIETSLMETRASGVPRWITLRPLSRKQYTPQQRGNDLVKRITLAKAHGAELIFADDVFHPEYGLLNSDGSPTPLFLPWRTAVLALRGAEFIGSLKLENGSRNLVFERDGEGIIVLWSDVTRTEHLSAGRNAAVLDIWGRRMTNSTASDPQLTTVRVGPDPVIVRGCSAAILRWKLSTRFDAANFASLTGAQQQTILGKNTFRQGVSGKVTLRVPPGWGVQPRSWQLRAAADEELRFPMRITVPNNASQGEVPVTIEFQIAADRTYTFRVHRVFRVVMGDVAISVVDRKLNDGRLEILQVITNNTQPEQILNFRTTLLAPGVRRQRRSVTKLRRGKDRKLYYLLDAEAVRGKELWIRAEQVGGKRVLNYRWKALENGSDTPRAEKKPVSAPRPRPDRLP